LAADCCTMYAKTKGRAKDIAYIYARASGFRVQSDAASSPHPPSQEPSPGWPWSAGRGKTARTRPEPYQPHPSPQPHHRLGHTETCLTHMGPAMHAASHVELRTQQRQPPNQSHSYSRHAGRLRSPCQATAGQACRHMYRASLSAAAPASFRAPPPAAASPAASCSPLAEENVMDELEDLEDFMAWLVANGNVTRLVDPDPVVAAVTDQAELCGWAADSPSRT
jgi:hypothetical protein